jgi:hypothetical protein
MATISLLEDKSLGSDSYCVNFPERGKPLRRGHRRFLPEVIENINGLFIM